MNVIFRKMKSCLAALALAMVMAPQASAELKLKVVGKKPPAAVSAEIGKTLEPNAIQLLAGDKPVFEIWLCKEIAVKSKPASADAGLKSIPQASLLGVIAATEEKRDYRDDELYQGVYTMRFVLKPQDGNHLGTSEFPYFVALVPAKLDKAVKQITNYDQLTEASSEDTASGHPMIMSLRPVKSDSGTFPQLAEPAHEHKSVRVKAGAKAADGAKTSLIFDLVYEGLGEI